MNAYRDSPAKKANLNLPKLWRPWMGRVGTVVVCLSSPVFICMGFVYLGTSDYTILWVIFSSIQAAVWIQGIIFASMDKKMSQKLAMTIAWGWLVYPCMGIARLCKWIVSGE